MCHEAQSQARPVPDDSLTPGSADDMSHHGLRPALATADLLWVSEHYYIDKHGHVAEWDHRIPFGCGGRTDRKNIWPQSSPAKIDKDLLEHWFERQVRLRRLTLAECQGAFATPNDWRARFLNVFHRKARE